MLTESRKKSMAKFIRMNCLTAMDEFPVETARAFIYMFEHSGWKLGSVDNQDFVDYFRERRSFSDKDESKWFDNNNWISPEWDKARYKGMKDYRLRLRMKVYGSKLKIDDLAVGFQSLSKIRPININRSIEEAFGEIVALANEMGDILIDAEAKGKRRWDVDVRKQMGEKHKSQKEVAFKKKLQPLAKYFDSIGYKLKVGKDYDVYHMTIGIKEMQDIPGANKGIYYPHQLADYATRVPFIVKRANQMGLWLISYGSNTSGEAWLEFKEQNPDKVAPSHYGDDPETGDNRSRQAGKENLKYDTVRKAQEKMVERTTSWASKMADNPEIHERCRQTIKEVIDNAQEEE